jgi:hypothetical protein
MTAADAEKGEVKLPVAKLRQTSQKPNIKHKHVMLRVML